MAAMLRGTRPLRLVERIVKVANGLGRQSAPAILTPILEEAGIQLIEVLGSHLLQLDAPQRGDDVEVEHPLVAVERGWPERTFDERQPAVYQVISEAQPALLDVLLGLH